MREFGLSRFHSQSGIAIGPILFIIAILAILGAAIAAGSGSFSGNTNKESSNVAASTILQNADYLKNGFDVVMTASGTTSANFTMLPNHTSNTTDVFSPTGGGVLYPTSHFGDPLYYGTSQDEWYFLPIAANSGFAISTTFLGLFLVIPKSTCDAINKLITGKSITAPSTNAFLRNAAYNYGANAMAPASQSHQMNGCFEDLGNYPSNPDAGGANADYIFFQILGALPDVTDITQTAQGVGIYNDAENNGGDYPVLNSNQ